MAALGSWKWNLEAPKAPITVSKIPNCPAVKVPIMTHLAPSPVKQSLANPISLAIFISLVEVDPVPPAPALLILLKRVSAGWEMMAAATPAMTPEAKEIEILVPLEHCSGPVFMES